MYVSPNGRTAQLAAWFESREDDLERAIASDDPYAMRFEVGCGSDYRDCPFSLSDQAAVALQKAALGLERATTLHDEDVRSALEDALGHLRTARTVMIPAAWAA